MHTTKLSPPKIEIPEKFNAAVHFIDRHLQEKRDNNIAIYYKDKKITYLELQNMVNRIGNALLNLGVEIENRVLLILQDCPEFIASFFAAIKIGAIPVPVSTMMSHKDYLHFLQDSRSKVLIISEELLPQVEPLNKTAGFLKHVIIVEKAKEGFLSYVELTSQASSSLEAADTCRDDACFWLFSSGSTGLPFFCRFPLYYHPFLSS